MSERVVGSIGRSVERVGGIDRVTGAQKYTADLQVEHALQVKLVHLDCAPAQQKEILDLIAYRKNAVTDPSVSQGVEFFAVLRNLTADGFFTSEIGIKYLGYIGNTFLKEFPGCPPVPS